MNNKLNTHTILNRSGTILFILIFYFSYFIIVLLFQPLLVVLKRCLKKSNKTSVLFLENFPQENAGYYYRSKVWTELLNKDGIHSSTVTIFKNKNKWEKHKLVMSVEGHDNAESILNALKHYNSLLKRKSKKPGQKF